MDDEHEHDPELLSPEELLLEIANQVLEIKQIVRRLNCNLVY